MIVDGVSQSSTCEMSAIHSGTKKLWGKIIHSHPADKGGGKAKEGQKVCGGERGCLVWRF